MLERSPILEFKFAEAGEAGTVAGLAAAYGGPDSLGDVIMPGAFTATLAEHAAAGTAPAMLWSHQMGEPLGRWTGLRETERGLEVTGKLSDTARGRDARTLATDGALGLSIGFRARQFDHDPNTGHRILREVELVEVSLVAIPANVRARITSIKSALAAGDPLTPRILEHALRDAGCPKSLAASVITKGWRGAKDDRREADDAAVSKIVNSLARHTAKLKEIR